jgi:hypothetical protein
MRRSKTKTKTKNQNQNQNQMASVSNITDVAAILVQQECQSARIILRLVGGNRELKNIIGPYPTRFVFCGEIQRELEYQFTNFVLMDTVKELVICWEHPDADIITEIMTKAAPQLGRFDVCRLNDMSYPPLHSIFHLSNPMNSLRELILFECDIRISWLPRNLVKLHIRLSTIAFEDKHMFGRLESLEELILESVTLEFGDSLQPLQELIDLPFPPVLQLLNINGSSISNFHLGQANDNSYQVFKTFPQTLVTLSLTEPLRATHVNLSNLISLSIREFGGFWCEESVDLVGSIGNVKDLELTLDIPSQESFHRINNELLLGKLSSLCQLETLTLHGSSNQAAAESIIQLLHSMSLEILEMRGWGHEGDVQCKPFDAHKGRLPKLMKLTMNV